MIENVEIINLKRLDNYKGFLMEVQRNDDSHFPGFGQVYISASKPGIVKAWYKHSKQLDQIVVASGKFRFVLFCDGELMEFDVDSKQPKLIQIPVEVWHGFKNIGEQEGILLHLNTIPYDFDSPDEVRLPLENQVINYSW